MRCSEVTGQPLGGLEGDQSILVTAAHQFQHAADMVDDCPRR